MHVHEPELCDSHVADACMQSSTTEVDSTSGLQDKQ